MPDLPLPKPQPPTSSTQATAPEPTAIEPTAASVVSATPMASAQTISSSQYSKPSPMGQQVAPMVATPSKPPAVVTALSSVSSNQVPTLNTVSDSPMELQSTGAINASSTPTSGSSVTPPPSIQSNKTQVDSQFNTSKTAVQDRGQQGTMVPQTNPVKAVEPANQVILPVADAPPVSLSQASMSKAPTTVTPSPSITPPPGSSTGVPLSSTTPSLVANPQSSQPAPLPLSSPPPPAGKTPLPPSPTPAKPKKSPKKLIVGVLVAILGLVAIAAVVMFVLGRFSGSSNSSSTTSTTTEPGLDGDSSAQNAVPSEQTTVEYWGLWETSDVLSQVLTDFQTQNPGLTVRYVQQSHRDFRERLQNAIVSGSGPDLFRFHASWVPMLSAELEPMPASVMSTSDFSQTFYPVASRQLQLNGQLIGIPLMYEGLVLYYNQDVLETAGVQPPQTWSALRDAARTLSIKQENGQLQRGGVAIGTAENVDHFADILAVLMLQNGANLEQPNSPEGRDALLFYTNFVKQDQVWSANMPSSTVAFARGDVAMMFAPSWRAFDITQINPNLRFAAVTLPQLPNNKITWASYWAEGVSQKSQNKEAAWKLLQYLSQKDVQQKLFSAQSQVRAFGEPFSRVDLADQAASQPIMGPLLQDAPTAQGWYMSSFTHDNGINDQIIQYYKDAVNSLLGSGNIDQVLVTLQQGVNQVLSTYGVVAPLEPTPTIAQY